MFQQVLSSKKTKGVLVFPFPRTAHASTARSLCATFALGEPQPVFPFITLNIFFQAFVPDLKLERQHQDDDERCQNTDN